MLNQYINVEWEPLNQYPMKNDNCKIAEHVGPWFQNLLNDSLGCENAFQDLWNVTTHRIKNPAYGRHSTSQRVRIVALIPKKSKTLKKEKSQCRMRTTRSQNTKFRGTKKCWKSTLPKKYQPNQMNYIVNVHLDTYCKHISE